MLLLLFLVACCCCCSWLFLVVAGCFLKFPVGACWCLLVLVCVCGGCVQDFWASPPDPPPPDRPSPGPPKISLFVFSPANDAATHCWMAFMYHLQAVSPTAPKCCTTQPNCVAQTQSTLSQREGSNRLCQCRGVVPEVQNLPTTEPHLTVMCRCILLYENRCHCPDEKIGLRCGTIQEEKPRCLQVLNRGNAGEQHSVLRNLRSQVVPNKLNLAHWRPQNFDPLDLIGQGVVASPHNGVFVRQPCPGLQGSARWRLMPSSIPHLGLAMVQNNVRLGGQLMGEDTVEFANSLGKAHRLNTLSPKIDFIH